MNDIKILILGSIFLSLLFAAGILTMFYIVGKFNKIVQQYDIVIDGLKKENEAIVDLVRNSMMEILTTLKDK